MADRMAIKRQARYFYQLDRMLQAEFLNQTMPMYLQIEKEHFAHFCWSIGKSWRPGSYEAQLQAIGDYEELNSSGWKNLEILKNAIT